MEDYVIVKHVEPFFGAHNFHKTVYQGMVVLVNLLLFADQAAHKNFFSQRKQQILTGFLIHLKNLRTSYFFARITLRVCWVMPR
jgi:hypothetical protein